MDAAVRLRTSVGDSTEAVDEDDALRKETAAELDGHSSPVHRFVNRADSVDSESLPLLSPAPRTSNRHAHTNTHNQQPTHTGSTQQQRSSTKVR